MKFRQLSLALTASLALATPTLAQDAQPAPTDPALAQDPPSNPQVYLGAEHGDWQLRCIATEEGPDPCRLYQALRDEAGNKVSEITLFNLPDGSEAVAGALIATPLESLLTPGIVIAVDEQPPKRYPFRYCTVEGCYAQVGLTEADLEAFRKGSVARLSIVPRANPDITVTVPISLKGFTAGYAAMVAQNTPE